MKTLIEDKEERLAGLTLTDPESEEVLLLRREIEGATTELLEQQFERLGTINDIQSEEATTLRAEIESHTKILIAKKRQRLAELSDQNCDEAKVIRGEVEMHGAVLRDMHIMVATAVSLGSLGGMDDDMPRTTEQKEAEIRELELAIERASAVDGFFPHELAEAKRRLHHLKVPPSLLPCLAPLSLSLSLFYRTICVYKLSHRVSSPLYVYVRVSVCLSG